MNLSELIERYDGKTLNRLEGIAKTALNKTLEFREKFIGILFYLRRTKRFKENPTYSNQPFKVYLANEWNMTLSAFDHERRLFTSFSTETKELGIAVTSKVIRNFNAPNAEAVMAQLLAIKEESSEQNFMERASEFFSENIETREANSTPLTARERRLERKIATLTEEKQALLTELNQANERINKLLNTVKERDDKIIELKEGLGELIAA